MEIREIIEKIAEEKKNAGGIKSVVWLAAGGSNGGNYQMCIRDRVKLGRLGGL